MGQDLPGRYAGAFRKYHDELAVAQTFDTLGDDLFKRVLFAIAVDGNGIDQT